MHQIVAVDLNNRHFPSTNYKEGETQSTKGCQTYEEAASTVTINQNIGQLFELLFRGFAALFGFHIWTMTTCPFLVSLVLKLDVMMYNL
jgi:hypothetical protein